MRELEPALLLEALRKLRRGLKKPILEDMYLFHILRTYLSFFLFNKIQNVLADEIKRVFSLILSSISEKNASLIFEVVYKF